MDPTLSSFDPPPAMSRPVRPLGLPVGSVRALLTLAALGRLVVDLSAHGSAPLWLVVTALLHAVAYASARASGGEARRHGAAPLGLPAGTIRVLTLAALGYGLWLYTRSNDLLPERAQAGWVLAAFGAGILARALMLRLRLPDDASTPTIYHIQALLTLAAAAGLVALGVKPDLEHPGWVEPLLAAVTAYYAGAR